MTQAPEGAAHEQAGASARQAALASVLRCLGGAYLSRALSEVVESAGLSGQDRSLAADLAYGTVRRLLSIDARLEPYLAEPGKLPGFVRAALRLGAYELLWRGTPAYAAVSAWVEAVKGRSPRHAGLVNAVLRRLARRLHEEGPAGGDPERDLSLPSWLYARFGAALGEEAAVKAARAMLEPEPLWLTASSEGAERSLREQACEVRPGPDLPLPGVASAWPRSLSVRCAAPLSALRAFREGLVQPQNPTSLYVARLLGARSGELVYDLAAGHGVKTATLAASGARVVAVELSAKRTEVARRNLGRMGLEVEHVVADAAAGWPGEDVVPGDRVLLDAPCSGSGTLRGNPEIKLRLQEADVGRLAELQAAMLRAAARVVRVGGTLLYAVCSLTPEEGVERAEAFLREVDGFDPLPVPEAPGVTLPVRVGAYLLPVEGLDGFYVARFRRRA